MKELMTAKLSISEAEMFSRLMKVGGYPEPFLSGEPTEYQRWRQSHIDIILKQDLYDLENIRDVRSIEILIQLLRLRVGAGWLCDFSVE